MRLKCGDILKAMEEGKLDGEIHQLIRLGYPMWMARRASQGLKKHGVRDFEELLLHIVEEAGELAQAVRRFRNEGGEPFHITDETIDLGSLCIQVLVTMAEKHGAENTMRSLGLWFLPKKASVCAKKTGKDR